MQGEAGMSVPGLVRAKALRNGQGGQAETPLGTMAGLLLGSPEFQRR